MALPSYKPELMRWGLVFLACPLKLDDSQKLELVKLAARAFFEEQSVVSFDWPGMAGEVRASSDVALLGNFVGQRFEARIDGTAGTGTLRFLVTEAQLQAAHPTGMLPPVDA